MSKEFEPAGTIAPDVALHAEAKQEYKFVGKIKMRPGMRLWGYNIATNTLAEVKVTKQAAVKMDGTPQIEQRAHHTDKTVYLQALNQKNAERKVEKLKKRFNL